MYGIAYKQGYPDDIRLHFGDIDDPKFLFNQLGYFFATGAITCLGGNSSNWNNAYSHISLTNNPHSVTKAQIGLSNVTDNAQWYSGNHPTTTSDYGLPAYPTTLPASDVSSWAKSGTKPSYVWSEIGSRPTTLSSFTNDLGNYGGFLTQLTSSGNVGFHNDTYYTDVANPIWSFAVAPEYGLSYYQCNVSPVIAGIYEDAIGFHFGNVSTPKFFATTSGKGYFAGTIYAPSINLTAGAGVNKVWQCTDSTTGAGQWASVTTTQSFMGTWNASTNTPALANGTGTTGYYYRVTTAGTSLGIAFSVGDNVIYNGTVWQRDPAPTIVGNALTKTDDTNVTITLGGSASTSLLNAASLTLGWTGTLADSRIASSGTWNAKEPGITVGTTGQYWRGDKSWQTLNSSAVGLGLVENTAISTWSGSSNISTLGTISTGTWHGSAIADSYISSAGTWNNKISLTSLSSSATGLIYSNTTGVFSLTPGYVIPASDQLFPGFGSDHTHAAYGDHSHAYAEITGTVPIWNQNTTGSAAKLTTARNINGIAFDGTADITVVAQPINPLDQSYETASGYVTYGSNPNIWADMAGLDFTFYPKGGHVLVIFTGSFSASSPNQGFTLQYNINGVNTGRQLQAAVSSAVSVISFPHLLSVTPGASCRIKMTWKAISSTYNSATDTLTVIDLP